jgi:transposase
MSGTTKIKIVESEETLRALLKQQKTALNYAKIQALYLLKIRAAEEIRYLAVMMGRSEGTMYEWLHLYKTGGLEKLLEEHPKSGRPKKLDVETVAQVQQELSDPEGFSSYQEVKIWLDVCQNIEISYATIHRLVRYELGGKLKVPRPYHEQQQPGVITAFKQHLPIRIKSIIAENVAKLGFQPIISYWCQDETRVGWRTELGHKITRPGVKPQQLLQWHYDYYYMYGLVEPVNVRSFFWEFSHFNSDCFGLFLEKFSEAYSSEIHIIQLDNAGVHTAKKLVVPENVVLLFQPPYCPELNPIERVWEYIKNLLKNLWFSNLSDVKDKVAEIVRQLSEDIIHSLTGWEHILNALSL